MQRAIPVLFALLVLAGCGGGGEPPPTEGAIAPQNVVVETVRRRPLEVRIKLPCITRPREEIELRAAWSGVVAEMPWKEGQVIPASPLPSDVDRIEDLKPFAVVNDKALTAQQAQARLDFEAADRAYHRVLSYKDSTESARDQAKTARDLAEARLAVLDQNLRDTRVCSPFEGVLTRRLRQAGEFVNTGELLGVLAVLDPLTAEFDVPEKHYDMVHEGDRFTITFPSLKGKSAEGVVTLVDAVAHPATHTFRVQMEIANQDRALPAGIFGTLEIPIRKAESAVLIPLDAVKLEGDRTVVFLAEGEKALRREVKVEWFSGNEVEVLEGLKEGDPLIVSGARALKDGDRIEVRRPVSAPANP